MQSKVLNTVVDSLNVRLGAQTRPTDWLLAAAEEWREVRKTLPFGAEPHVTEIPTLGSFELLMTSHRHYEFILMNPEIADIRIINPKRWCTHHAYNTGQLFISFRSRFMQHEGIPGVYEFLEKVKDVMMVPYRVDSYLKVSQMDLAADIQVDQFFQWDDLDRFVSRSRCRDVYVENVDAIDKMFEFVTPPEGLTRGALPTRNSQNVVIPRDVAEAAKGGWNLLKSAIGPDATLTRVCHSRDPQTLYFGSRKAPLYARIYDKTAEIKKSGKGYMKDFWRALGWDGVSPVARVEFVVRGDMLKSVMAVWGSDSNESSNLTDAVVDLRDLDVAVRSIPQLWKYLTGDWLRFCDRGSKSNPWRWEVSELWQQVQGAWPEAIPAIRVRPQSNPNLDQMKAQLQGILLSTAVLTLPKGSNIDAPDHLLAEIVEWVYGDEFRERYQFRRCVMGRDEVSDAWFNEEVRRQQMLQGMGS